MNKRKPLEPILTQHNGNIQLTNETIKQEFTSKSTKTRKMKKHVTNPYEFLNEEDYIAYWNQYETLKNLQNALDQTNSMNLKIEEELNRLSNIENELKDQVTLNQQLYDKYVQYRDQKS